MNYKKKIVRVIVLQQLPRIQKSSFCTILVTPSLVIIEQVNLSVGVDYFPSVLVQLKN